MIKYQDMTLQKAKFFVCKHNLEIRCYIFSNNILNNVNMLQEFSLSFPFCNQRFFSHIDLVILTERDRGHMRVIM